MGNSETKLTRHLRSTDTFKATDDDLAKYEFPFENLVLDGGGAKGLAHVGVIKVLDNVGILANLKRIAGTSVGGLLACAFAIGYTPYECIELMGRNELQNVASDHCCGYCSFLPNLLCDYGWNPGNKLLKWCEKLVEAKTGDRHTTFKQLYEMTGGKELCITTTNVNNMHTVYCHVKTTPDMPIALAVRMSISFPGFYRPVTYKNDYYVDGGVLANYPIFCFDGWWLSLKPEDSFLLKLQPLDTIYRLYDNKVRFGEDLNTKTLGSTLISQRDKEVYRNVMQGCNSPPVYRPDTKLARNKTDFDMEHGVVHRDNYCKLAGAMNQLLQVLADSNIQTDQTIDREDFESTLSKAIQNGTFTVEHGKRLFGDKWDVNTVSGGLDFDRDGKITYQELVKFAEAKGVHILERFTGDRRTDIYSAFGFAGAVINTMLLNLQRGNMTESDLERSIVVDADYLDTLDMKLDMLDKAFAIEQGMKATRTFLAQYIARESLPSKST
ncbi:uncharacterized protein LOC144434474 [Glandiceps talaboti]